MTSLIIGIPVKNKQVCGYKTLDNSLSCSLSSNWGKYNKWNTEDSTNRFSQSIDGFNLAVTYWVSGFATKVHEISINHDFTNETIEELDIKATALTRISTMHQIKAMGLNEDEFTGLIKSINKKPLEVAQYIEEGFNHSEGFVYLKPVEGKANVATLLFRVPYITNLFTQLYKSTGKTLVARIDGKDRIVNLKELYKLQSEGLTITYNEKIIMYIPNCHVIASHFTQLLGFAFGLFQMQPQELVNMIEDATKGLINEERLSKAIKGAIKMIDAYRTSFMLEDQAILIYMNKLESFGDLMRKSTKYGENQSVNEKSICVIDECNRTPRRDFLLCKAHLIKAQEAYIE